MKIALEARALSRPASGVKTYVHHLVQALGHAGQDNEYDILDHGPRHEALWPLWLNTTVPRWLAAQTPDIVHFTKAAIPQRKQFPTVVTIYDVIPVLFPESQKTFARLIWPRVLHHAAYTADHIITISEASKRDIVEQLQISADKITVTPLAVNRVTSRQLRVTSRDIKPYILFLGTIEPRKNVPALVRAFAKIAKDVPHRLAIAGRQYKGMEDVRNVLRTSGVMDRVDIRDFVPQEELHALYANADLFVWPSIYEGWGFPPQEAMAAGVPVIVSNGGSLPEVVGAAGIVVPFTAESIGARTHDEYFEAALADHMRAVLTSPEKQAHMRELGLEQIKRNSWEEVARVTLEVYHRVV